MLRILILLFIAITSIQVISQDEDELAKINRELDNPLAKRWSLVFQENLSINRGSLIDGNTISNSFYFQPALPIPVGKNLVFTARPVFPLVTSPDFSKDASGNQKVTGFGDIQMATLIGPGKASGWIWGAGLTFIFPTASNDNLGQGQYQMGPSLLLLHMGEKWNKGIFAQHWWSYAGTNEFQDISITDLQYILRRNIGRSSIGMGPTIRIDWTKEFNEGVTIPVGLGYTRTILIGKIPYKIRLEPQYSIISPDNYGSVWNIRFQIAPVIKSPFFN